VCENRVRPEEPAVALGPEADQSSEGLMKITPAPRKIALDFSSVRKNTAIGLMSHSC
jgi:hypothetical protein